MEVSAMLKSELDKLSYEELKTLHEFFLSLDLAVTMLLIMKKPKC